MRKDEKLRNEQVKNNSAMQQLNIEPSQNIKSGYLLKKEHSVECEDLYNQKKN